VEIAKSHGRSAGSTVFLVGIAFAAMPLLAQSGLPADTSPRQMTGALPEVPSAEKRMRPEPTPATASVTISADLLRHPITEKARRMLQRALQKINSGNHAAAIEQLRETLAIYPGSAAYAHSLLGVEYLKTDRFTAAVSSLEQAVSLLPHDAINRYNLGLSLVCAGDYERGEQEVRRAIELDPNNTTMEALLNALVQRKRSGKLTLQNQ
jgi:Flp pilus assembly protein TadD